MINPSSNEYPLQPQSRAPRGIVKINGSIVEFVSFQIDNNTNYQADAFRVDILVDTLPNDLLITNLIGADVLQVEILVGIPSNPNSFSTSDLVSMILGNVDDLTYDPVNQVIILTGRDLTSVFQDAKKTAEQFKNQTSSQVANFIAQNHDLKTNITNTTQKIGNYTIVDKVLTTKNITEWDLLTYLAGKEGFSVFVKDKTLNFIPLAAVLHSPYIIQITPSNLGKLATSNIIDIRFSHNKTLAKDVKVVVKSWNMLQANGFTVTATNKHTRNKVSAGASPPVGAPQEYDYTFPNLTRDDAQNKANELAAQISKHELRLNATLVGDNNLTVDSRINVIGTNTNFDQIYFPSSITRRMSLDEGYIMEVIAKNSSPESQVTI